MLYGSVRELHHHSSFLERAAWALDLGTDAGKSKKKENSRSDIVTVGIIFAVHSFTRDGAYIRAYKKRRSPYVVAVLQVSVLNGSDLKTMINYTGEQVSRLQKAPPRSTSSVFSLPGSS